MTQVNPTGGNNNQPPPSTSGANTPPANNPPPANSSETWLGMAKDSKEYKQLMQLMIKNCSREIKRQGDEAVEKMRENRKMIEDAG
ncbi:MAG: hypothetical protein HY069_02960 [Chlamydiia bacterium]|nr:hypothetical protein [Chlamydiia bacterium]